MGGGVRGFRFGFDDGAKTILRNTAETLGELLLLLLKEIAG